MVPEKPPCITLASLINTPYSGHGTGESRLVVHRQTVSLGRGP